VHSQICCCSSLADHQQLALRAARPFATCPHSQQCACSYLLPIATPHLAVVVPHHLMCLAHPCLVDLGACRPCQEVVAGAFHPSCLVARLACLVRLVGAWVHPSWALEAHEA
jgi:hypothetical protein